MDSEPRTPIPSVAAPFPTADTPVTPTPLEACAPCIPIDHRLFSNLYTTLDELMAELNNWGKGQGLGFVKRRSCNHVDGKPTRVDIICDRGNLRPSRANTRKPTTTKSADCQWKATARALRQNDRLWSLQIAKPNHNHPASSSLSTHTVHRKLTREIQNLIMAMTKATRLKPREIYGVLKLAYPDAVLTLRDIENYRNRLFASGQSGIKRPRRKKVTEGDGATEDTAMETTDSLSAPQPPPQQPLPQLIQQQPPQQAPQQIQQEVEHNMLDAFQHPVQHSAQAHTSVAMLDGLAALQGQDRLVALDGFAGRA